MKFGLICKPVWLYFSASSDNQSWLPIELHRCRSKTTVSIFGERDGMRAKSNDKVQLFFKKVFLLLDSNQRKLYYASKITFCFCATNKC